MPRRRSRLHRIISILWDGLTTLFVELVNADKTLLEDTYIKKWYRLSC